MNVDIFVSAAVNGCLNGGIYALLALAIVLIYRATDVANFAQGEMAALGAFLFFLVILPLGLPVWVSVGLTVMAGAAVGAAIYAFVMAPNADAGHLNKTVRSLALFGMIFSISLIEWGANEPYRVPSLFGDGAVSFFHTNVGYDQLGSVAVTLGLAAILLTVFRYSRMGLRMRAVATDPKVASLLGIDVRFVTLSVWIVAGMIGAIVGLLVAPVTFLETSLMRPYILKAFTAAIIGGMGSFPGAIVGGLLLGLAEAFATVGISHQFREPFIFAILLLVLLFRPGGLFGAVRKVRV